MSRASYVASRLTTAVGGQCSWTRSRRSTPRLRRDRSVQSRKLASDVAVRHLLHPAAHLGGDHEAVRPGGPRGTGRRAARCGRRRRRRRCRRTSRPPRPTPPGPPSASPRRRHPSRRRAARSRARPRTPADRCVRGSELSMSPSLTDATRKRHSSRDAVRLPRAQDGRGPVGPVRRVREQLRLQGDAVTLAVAAAARGSAGAVEEVAGVDLQPGLVGEQLQPGAGARGLEDGGDAQPVAADDVVVVDPARVRHLRMLRPDRSPMRVGSRKSNGVPATGAWSPSGMPVGVDRACSRRRAPSAGGRRSCPAPSPSRLK